MVKQTDNKLITWLGVALILASVLILCVDSADSTDVSTCQCDDPQLCLPRKKKVTTEPQVFIFSGQTTDIHLWRWSTINTVIVPPNFSMANPHQAKTLCITRAKDRNFAITVEFNQGVNASGILSPQDLDVWRNSVVLKQKAWQADYINIDFLPYFSSDSASRKEHHGMVADTLHKLKADLSTEEFLCVVPWLPPCAEDGYCGFTQWVRDTCDYFIINPDSFLDTKGSKCVARANIPFSKMLYGISEYNSHHVASSKLILGVSWHGYDYTCSKLMGNLCYLPSQAVNNSEGSSVELCDYSQRQRVSHGDILSTHALDYNKHKDNVINNSPYFNYKNGSTNHQVWFENQKSLTAKYRLVNELEFKGIAILFGSDLSPTNSPNLLANEDLMWSWLAHEYIHTIAKKSAAPDLHWADTVAGVAVGCLVLGTALGVIFTCIGMQRRVKKPRYTFSRKDTEPFGDEYTDDPNL